MSKFTPSAPGRKVAKSRIAKPKKPYPDFPLFAHATRRWAKKIRGRLHYFGPWEDVDGALNRYLRERDYLHSGRTPPVETDGLTIRELCNRYLTVKRGMLQTGEIVDRTFREYYLTCESLVKTFGRDRLVADLNTDDFKRLRSKLAKTRGLIALGNEVQRVRMVFKFGYDEELIDKPLRYGQSFRKPSKKAIRKRRSSNGKRMFEACELREMLESAAPPLKAMILLAINCGFGQSDIATLPLGAIDFRAGWISYPRPKTGVERRCPLWPETVTELTEAISLRPPAKERADKQLARIIHRYGNKKASGCV